MQPNPTLYGQQNNNQKIRFIIITSIVAIVVLGIAVWAIVAMPETNGRLIGSPHLANDAGVRAGCRGTGFKLK